MEWINIIIYGILSIFLAAWLYHFFTKKRDSKKTFNIAANKFSDAFNDFIVMLETNFQYETGPIKNPIPDHIVAAFKFRQHLGWFSRKGFDRKLAQYKQAAKEYDDIEKYVGLKNIPHEKNLKLLKQIVSLLKYAKYK